MFVLLIAKRDKGHTIATHTSVQLVYVQFFYQSDKQCFVVQRLSSSAY